MCDRRQQRQSTEYADEVLQCQRRIDVLVDNLEQLVVRDAEQGLILRNIREIKRTRQMVRECSEAYFEALRTELQEMIPTDRPVAVAAIVPEPVEEELPTVA